MAERERAIDLAQKLIAKAESTTFDEEKKALLAKADALMAKHMIDEWEVSKREARKIEIKTLRMEAAAGSVKHVHDPVATLASAVALHTRCRIVFHGLTAQAKWNMPLSVTVVGMESDVEYFEMLFTSLRLHALNSIDPAYDPAKTKDENIFAMKNAGLKWATIAYRCGDYPDEASFNAKDSSWITAYKRECKRQGVAPIGAQPKNYQFNFMQAYAFRISDRLYEIRKESEVLNDTGNALVLFDAKAKVDEAYAEMFPNLRSSKLAVRKSNSVGRDAGIQTANRADLGLTRVGQSNRGAINS